jgi:hypothetical protein
MKYSTYRFTLDLQKHQSQISIAVFQYDTAVRFYINLTDGGIPYQIADGCRAVFYGKRPDGTDLIHPCMIEGNTRIIYDFNDQTAYCEGTVDAQICLYGIDGNLITAPRLIIVANAKTVNTWNTPLEENKLSALEQIIASETAREKAELARDKAENGIFDDGLGYIFKGRVQAEADRVRAEAERVRAEAERVEAEKQRGREAQKWVTGSYVDENGDTQNVTSEDPQFENNAVYYAGKAAESAEEAANSAASAKNYAEVTAPRKAEEAANTILGAVNNRLDTLDTEMYYAENRLGNAEDRLDNVDYILEQFGAVKAQVDSSAALVKSIPARSDLFAYLNSVGGKTEKYNQLLNLPEGAGTGYYFWQLAEGSSLGQQLNEKITTVMSGVTIVNNGNGSFTLSGTAEKYVNFALFNIFNFSTEDYSEQYAFSIPVPDGNLYLSFGGASLPAGAYVYVGTDIGTDEGGNGGEVSATGGALSISLGWHITVMYLNFEAGTVFNNLTIKPMLNLGTSALPWQSPADPFTELRSGKVTALKVYGANLLDVSKCVNKCFVDNGDGTYTIKGVGTSRTSEYAPVHIPANTDFYINAKALKEAPKPVGILAKLADGTKQGVRAFNESLFAKKFSSDVVGIGFYIQGSGTNADGMYGVYSDFWLSLDNVGYFPYKAEPTTYELPEAVKALDGYGEGNPYNTSEYNTVDFENQIFIKKGAISSGEWESFTTPEVTDISAELEGFDPVIPVEGGGRIEFFNEFNYDVPSTITYNIIQEA